MAIWRLVRRLAYEVATTLHLDRLSRLSSAHGVTILGFHGVVGESDDRRWPSLAAQLSAKRFEKYVGWLERRYVIISLDRATRILNGEEEPIRNAVVLTFDDGYKNNFFEVLEILERHNVSGTMYVVSDYVENGATFWFDRVDYCVQHAAAQNTVLKWNDREYRLNEGDIDSQLALFADIKATLKSEAESDPELLERVESICRQLAPDYMEDLQGRRGNGHWSAVANIEDVKLASRSSNCEVGSHTATHARISKIDALCRDDELSRSKATIERWSGRKCNHLAYPNGVYDEASVDAVKKAGYLTAVTSDSGRNFVGDDLLRLKRIFPGHELSRGEFLALVSGLTARVDSVRRRIVNCLTLGRS